MSIEDVNNMLKGGSVVAVLTLIGATIKTLVERSTTLSVKKIDSTTSFQEAMDKRFESLWKKVESTDAMMSGLRMRDAIFMRCFSSVSGELRYLNGLLSIHLIELKADNLDKVYLRQNTEQMQESLMNMKNCMQDAEKDMQQIATEHIKEVKDKQDASEAHS